MSFDLTYHSLVDKYEKTKRELGDTEHTIRRITGRDPDEFLNGVTGSKFRPSSVAARGAYAGRKRNFRYSFRKNSRSPSYDKGKKESTDEDEEEEDDDDDDELPHKKPTLQSTVVAKRRHPQSRKSIIEEQNANSKIKARNRRMFGALIGTLEKFQDEEKKRQHKESMRAEIEQKVEAATEEEKERIKKEKEMLFITRREKQVQLRCLEKKMERAESHDVYDKNHRYMQKFIKTKSKPPIFFCPLRHNSASKKCLEETRVKIQELIKEKKKCLEEDLLEIEEWYKKDANPGDKENACPKAESESQDVPESETESLVIEQEDTNLENEDSNNAKAVESATDQDFEPIYD